MSHSPDEIGTRVGLPEPRSRTRCKGLLGVRLSLPALIVLTVAFAQPFAARATRSAILADLGGPTAPGTALAGTPEGLYVAHAADIRWYSVADPDHPRLVESIPPLRLPAPAARLVAAGDWLVAADEAGGLTVIDVSERQSPRSLGTLSLGSGPPRDVLVHGDHLLVVDARGGLRIILLTRGQPPRPLSDLEASHGLLQLAVDRTRIYATAFTSRSVIYGPETLWLVTIDWSDPRSPHELGASSLASASGYNGLWPSGIRAAQGKLIVLLNHSDWSPFISIDAGSYLLIDPADPQAARIVVRVDADAEGTLLAPNAVGDVGRVTSLPGMIFRSVSGSVVSEVDLSDPTHVLRRHLQAVDVSDPTHPIFGTATAVLEESLRDFTLAGPRIYALGYHGSLIAVANATALSLTPATAVETAPRAAAVAIADGHAFVAYHRAGLGVFDLADPAGPRRSAWLDLPDSRPSDLELNGSTAILAEGDMGVRLIDLRDPTAPRPLAMLDTPGSAVRLSASGHLVAIADGPAGLSLVDVADPAAPVPLSTIDLGTSTTDVVLDGARAFVATIDKGLMVVDVSDPRNPRVVPDTPPLQADRLAVADRRLYISGQHLAVLSLDDLQLLGQYPAKDEDCCFHPLAAMTASAGFVYLVSQEFGLEVLDARDPRQIDVAARSGLPGIPKDVALGKGFVYSADWHWGLRVSRATVGASVHGIYLPALPCPNPTSAFHPIVSPELYQRLVGEVQPALSPDGRRLATVADNGGSAAPSLRIMEVDSGDVDYVALPPEMTAVESPTFSKDGRSLVFAGRQLRWDVFRLSLEDRRLANLTGSLFGPRSQQRRPSLSPDGNHLAFDRLDADATDGTARAEDIFSMDLGTGKVRQLTTHPAIDRFPSYSPDGSRLVFRSERDGQSELYAMAADGSDVERLTDNPAFDGYPSYSPNERWIVFQSARGGSDQVFMLDLKSKLVLPLTELEGPAREPRFAPGSDWVLFSMPNGFYDYGTGRSYAQVAAVDLPPGLR